MEDEITVDTYPLTKVRSLEQIILFLAKKLYENQDKKKPQNLLFVTLFSDNKFDENEIEKMNDWVTPNDFSYTSQLSENEKKFKQLLAEDRITLEEINKAVFTEFCFPLRGRR